MNKKLIAEYRKANQRYLEAMEALVDLDPETDQWGKLWTAQEKVIVERERRDRVGQKVLAALAI